MIARPVRSSLVLTCDGTVPTAADTVTIGGQVYTYRAAVGATANEVLLGAAGGTEAMTNLYNAINVGTGSGVTYGSATVANAYVTATNPTAATVKVTSKVPGTVANFISCAEASTHLSWAGAATALAGGTGTVNGSVDDMLSTMQPNAQIITVLLSMTSNPQ